MNDDAILLRVRELIALVDDYGQVYDLRWAGAGFRDTRDDLHSRLLELEDQVRGRARVIREVAVALGEADIAGRVDEHQEGM